MAIANTFEQYLITSPTHISIPNLIIAIILAAILSFVLGKLYVKYGTALSNRKKFASIFVLLTVTTTLIITVVKSSLALSLGLVGALSIVRFRAAIKEPEELVFLFLNIAIGLGLGANQFTITIVAFMLITIFILFRHFRNKKEESQNISLIITSKDAKNISLQKINIILKKYCSIVNLKRFDIDEDILEASFFVTFNSLQGLINVKKELRNLSKSIRISYVERE